jgi:hypothetical protein
MALFMDMSYTVYGHDAENTVQHEQYESRIDM